MITLERATEENTSNTQISTVDYSSSEIGKIHFITHEAGASVELSLIIGLNIFLH